MDHVLGDDLDLWPHDLQRISASAVTWPIMYQRLEKPKISAAEFTGSIVHAGNHLGIYSRILDPLAEYKLLMSYALAPQRLDSCFRHSSSVTIPKFEDRSRDLRYAPLT